MFDDFIICLLYFMTPGPVEYRYSQGYIVLLEGMLNAIEFNFIEIFFW